MLGLGAQGNTQPLCQEASPWWSGNDHMPWHKAPRQEECTRCPEGLVGGFGQRSRWDRDLLYLEGAEGLPVTQNWLCSKLEALLSWVGQGCWELRSPPGHIWWGPGHVGNLKLEGRPGGRAKGQWAQVAWCQLWLRVGAGPRMCPVTAQLLLRA